MCGSCGSQVHQKAPIYLIGLGLWLVVGSAGDLEQMEEEATEVLSNLNKVRESWFEDVKASGLSPSADSDKKAFREFKTNQTGNFCSLARTMNRQNASARL